MNRRILVLAVLVLMSIAPAAAQTKPAGFDFKVRMNTMLRAWETLDPAKAAPYYDKDPKLAFYDIVPFKYTGWEEYAKGVIATFAGTYQSGKFFLHDDINLHRGPKVTWATASLDFEILRKDGGRELLKDLRWTLIWEKRGNDWLLVHEHLSAPMGTEPQLQPK
ncbi:MAG: nuclear transport factor 2 family protein [Acidobacteria bacterium]|nr:nuclear transport factor 2 family protein [Acidobacteriota bacterium]